MQPIRPGNVSAEATCIPYVKQSPVAGDLQMLTIHTIETQIQAMNSQKNLRYNMAMNDWAMNDAWYQAAHRKNPQAKPVLVQITLTVVWANDAGVVGNQGPVMNAWLDEEEA